MTCIKTFHSNFVLLQGQFYHLVISCVPGGENVSFNGNLCVTYRNRVSQTVACGPNPVGAGFGEARELRILLPFLIGR